MIGLVFSTLYIIMLSNIVKVKYRLLISTSLAEILKKNYIDIIGEEILK